jgi:predicted  nucleic acid-binding Zn-ribbon protein
MSKWVTLTQEQYNEMETEIEKLTNHIEYLNTLRKKDETEIERLRSELADLSLRAAVRIQGVPVRPANEIDHLKKLLLRAVTVGEDAYQLCNRLVREREAYVQTR